MIREIPLPLLPRLWSSLGPHLERALRRHPFLDLEGLQWLAFNGRAYIIAVLDGDRIAGVIALDIQQYPKKRIGNVLALGGEIGSLERFSDEVESFLLQWCRENSLDSLGMLGRPGWSKYLARRGWHVQPIICAWKDVLCTSRKFQPMAILPSQTEAVVQ